MTNQRRTIEDIRREANNLGMNPQEAGEYIEREWQAQQDQLEREAESGEEE